MRLTNEEKELINDKWNKNEIITIERAKYWIDIVPSSEYKTDKNIRYFDKELSEGIWLTSLYNIGIIMTPEECIEFLSNITEKDIKIYKKIIKYTKSLKR